MTAISDLDARLMAVHAEYLKAERRGQVAEAADLWNQLDDLLDQRSHIPVQRLPADADGHTSPRPL